MIDETLMDACETLGRAMFRGLGSCVVHRYPNGPWIADLDSSQGLLMSASATSKRAAIEGLYCALWIQAFRWDKNGTRPTSLVLIMEAVTETEGLFGLPASGT